MAEFDEWWRRTRRFFEEIDRMFDELFREAFAEAGRPGRGERRVYGPYYYGFSVTIGPDGVPRVREWGNIKPGYIGGPRITEAIEPFTDVIEEEDKVRIVEELRRMKPRGIDLDLIVLSSDELDDPLVREMIREALVLYDGLNLGKRIPRGFQTSARIA